MKTNVAFSFIFLFLSILHAQENKISWQRSAPVQELDLFLFHSMQSVNLPTTETLQKNDLEFEISHRFIPTIRTGGKELWGFDGPVNIRFALAYGITNKTVVALGRSNLDDNYDLTFKQKVFQFRNDILPTVIGIRAGAAWNTDIPNRKASHNRNFQYYAQLIINSMYNKKFAVGLVPSYLYNAHVTCPDIQYSFTMGTYAQYYLNDLLSILVEWNATITGWRQYHNPVSFGIELETGGHFFKVVMTNSAELNSSQFLSGADLPFNDGNWRIGFNITRLLKL